MTTPFIRALGLVMALTAPVAANAAKQVKEVSDFTHVDLRGSSGAIITQGSSFQLVVDGPKATLPQAKIKVKGDTLHLSVEDKGWFDNVDASKVIFHITMPVVEGLTVSGSGNFNAGELVGKEMSLYVRGSGDIDIESLTATEVSASVKGSGDVRIDEIAALKLSAEVKGSGDIRVGGEVQRLSISIMGSGDFDGRKLVSESASAAVMGSGDIRIKKTAFKTKKVFGSGDIHITD